MKWREEFIEKIGCSNPSEIKIEEAQLLKFKNMPKFLYKYRPASDYAIKNLITDTVWLNKPSEYNDPFEFVEYLDINKLRTSIVNLMKEEIIENLVKDNYVPNEIINTARNSNSTRNIFNYILEKKVNLNSEQINEINKISDNLLKENIIDIQVSKLKSLQDKMKVCSFCESPKQLLMWSHYADSHQGFCVEYNIGKWDNNDIRKKLMYPVNYTSDFFDFTNHLINRIEHSDFNNLYPIISGSTKSLEWEYEKEWRLIFAIGDSFPSQNYPLNCQTKVYIGSRMCKKKRTEIIEICEIRKIKVYDAVPSNDKYEILFERIK